MGTDADDMMVGTDQEDYLAGGNGNDDFVVGAGKDGINGGAGDDRLMLGGTPADYAIRVQGNGHLISGPSGDKFVINVETFLFESGDALTLADMVATLPETLGTPGGDGAPSGDPADAMTSSSSDDHTQLQNPIELDMTGQLHDAVTLGETTVASDALDAEGVIIRSVEKNSALKAELDLRSEDFEKAYVVYERGKTVDVVDNNGDIEAVLSRHFSVQENRINKDGAFISDSALETALMFGDVVLDPTSIRASNGDDIVIGRSLADTFFGDAGNDYINGKVGDDHLHGGAGNDVLVGGLGADRFYLTVGDGQDLIEDFSIGEDMLILTDYLADGQTLEDAAMLDDGGNLVISNGVDQVTLDGLDLDDLSWLEGA
jgi:Ca2+-binding RTX toxin-like protein